MEHEHMASAWSASLWRGSGAEHPVGPGAPLVRGSEGAPWRWKPLAFQRPV